MAAIATAIPGLASPSDAGYRRITTDMGYPTITATAAATGFESAEWTTILHQWQYCCSSYQS